MKNTGIVRMLDDLGRITVPKELRRTLDLPTGTPMEIYTDNGRVVLEKYRPVTWSADELEGALAAAAKDAGKDPVEYLMREREAKT